MQNNSPSNGDHQAGSDPPATPLPERVLALLARAGKNDPRNGPRLAFCGVMQEALYGPGGYYRAGTGCRVGKEGDFFTSVSVGPLFGQLLARHCRELWQAMGMPARFALVEQGADNGQLMADILAASRHLDPALTEALVPWTVEPLDELARLQRDTVGAALQSVPTPEDLPADLPPGLFYCNELVDALAVCRVRYRGEGRWQELHLTPEGFCWLEPDTPGLLDELDRIARSHSLPEDYETEVHLEALSWVRSLAASPFTGHLLAIDYGFLEDDYYHPDRSCGTLQAYRDHRKVEIEPGLLGEVDLTAHVNFSSLLREALDAGFCFLGFESQGAFLTHLAREWLLGIEADSSRPSQEKTSARTDDLAGQIRQFQTLTHPGMLGGRFHVLGLWKPPTTSSLGEATATAALPQLSGLAGSPAADQLLCPPPRA